VKKRWKRILGGVAIGIVLAGIYLALPNGRPPLADSIFPAKATLETRVNGENSNRHPVVLSTYRYPGNFESARAEIKQDLQAKWQIVELVDYDPRKVRIVGQPETVDGVGFCLGDKINFDQPWVRVRRKDHGVFVSVVEPSLPRNYDVFANWIRDRFHLYEPQPPVYD